MGPSGDRAAVDASVPMIVIRSSRFARLLLGHLQDTAEGDRRNLHLVVPQFVPRDQYPLPNRHRRMSLLLERTTLRAGHELGTVFALHRR